MGRGVLSREDCHVGKSEFLDVLNNLSEVSDEFSEVSGKLSKKVTVLSG